MALARGLELLRCFTPLHPRLSNGELAERSGLPKSTVSRLTGTLVDLGYLRQDGRAYRVGPAVLGLGYAALSHLKVKELLAPHMKALADATQTMVSLATRDRLRMIYLENCRGGNNVTLRVGVGTHLPMETTSIGRAYLAALPESERDALLAQLAERVGSGWPTVEAAIRREIERHGRDGYCLSLGDWRKDTHAAAVALATPPGGDLVVMSISGPAFAVTARQLEEELAPRLVALARHAEGLLAESAGR